MIPWKMIDNDFIDAVVVDDDSCDDSYDDFYDDDHIC